MIEIEGCQAETMRVIGKAEEYVRENKITKGQIWCVYDKDSFPSNDVNGVVQRAEVLNQRIRIFSIMRRGVMSVSNSGLCYILHITQRIITGRSIRNF